jgi:hypothetical protein
MARPKNGVEKEGVTWSAECELLEAIDDLRNGRFPVPDRSAMISELVYFALYGLRGNKSSGNGEK